MLDGRYDGQYWCQIRIIRNIYCCKRLQCFQISKYILISLAGVGIKPRYVYTISNRVCSKKECCIAPIPLHCNSAGGAVGSV